MLSIGIVHTSILVFIFNSVVSFDVCNFCIAGSAPSIVIKEFFLPWWRIKVYSKSLSYICVYVFAMEMLMKGCIMIAIPYMYYRYAGRS